MSGSSLDSLSKQPANITRLEWELYLLGTVGPLRGVYGDGPRQTGIAAGAAELVARNSARDKGMLVIVQINPGSPAVPVFFGRATGTAPGNGLAHPFAAVPTFTQVLYPSDELYCFSALATVVVAYQVTL